MHTFLIRPSYLLILSGGKVYLVMFLNVFSINRLGSMFSEHIICLQRYVNLSFDPCTTIVSNKLIEIKDTARPSITRLVSVVERKWRFASLIPLSLINFLYEDENPPQCQFVERILRLSTHPDGLCCCDVCVCSIFLL